MISSPCADLCGATRKTLETILCESNDNEKVISESDNEGLDSVSQFGVIRKSVLGPNRLLFQDKGESEGI